MPTNVYLMTVWQCNWFNLNCRSLGDSRPKRLCQTSLFSLACRSYLTSSTFWHMCPWSCLHRQVASTEVRSVLQVIECFGHTFYTVCRPKDSNSGIRLLLRRPHQVRFAPGLRLNSQKWPNLDPTDTKRTCCGRQSRNQMPELESLGDSRPKRLCQTSLFSLAYRSYLTSSTFRHMCPWSWSCCLNRR